MMMSPQVRKGTDQRWPRTKRVMPSGFVPLTRLKTEQTNASNYMMPFTGHLARQRQSRRKGTHLARCAQGHCCARVLVHNTRASPLVVSTPERRRLKNQRKGRGKGSPLRGATSAVKSKHENQLPRVVRTMDRKERKSRRGSPTSSDVRVSQIRDDPAGISDPLLAQQRRWYHDALC